MKEKSANAGTCIRLVTGFLIMFSSLAALPQQKTITGRTCPYNLDHPADTFILPSVLKEISGITLLNPHTMICIQDEKGDLFFYALDKKQLIRRVDFGKDADYEDVTLAGNEVYVLRSNGTLYRLTHFEAQKTIRTEKIETCFSKKNNCEGLCYDPAGNRLLIALKGKPEATGDQDFGHQKAIYAYDLQKRKLLHTPAFLISREQVATHVSGISDNPGDFRFQPSAVAVHPLTGEIYVLASVGKVLLVLDRDGQLLSVTLLDKRLFRQPEGLCFDTNGTLYISSEGDGQSGTMMKFEMEDW